MGKSDDATAVAGVFAKEDELQFEWHDADCRQRLWGVGLKA
jgi:hypothetical protein